MEMGGTRGRDDRGEGVISTAIAVLIIAFLGVAMWVGFKAIFDDAAQTTQNQVQQIGR
jgi:type VI protein secretion system component VasF